jgi:hypothetical protein
MLVVSMLGAPAFAMGNRKRPVAEPTPENAT